jgi:uncharacterized RDD family membrane protein YckC
MQEHLQEAGFWRRFAAYTVDIVIVAVGGLVVEVVLGLLAVGIATVFYSSPISGVYYAAQFRFAVIAQVLSWLIALAGFWLYFSLQESSSRQATLGKLLLAIRVADLQGDRVSFSRATGRTAGKILSWLLCNVGFLMAAFTARRQGLHDIIAGTLVIRTRPDMVRQPEAAGSTSTTRAVVLSIAAAVGVLVLIAAVVALLVYALGPTVKETFSNLVSLPD